MFDKDPKCYRYVHQVIESFASFALHNVVIRSFTTFKLFHRLKFTVKGENNTMLDVLVE